MLRLPLSFELQELIMPGFIAWINGKSFWTGLDHFQTANISHFNIQ